MVQGMAFLSKKGFNPHNNVNRKQVWEAQQHSKQEKERLRRRQQQLKREQEDRELELATKGEIGGSQAQLRFMYDAPPGLEKTNKDTDDFNGDDNYKKDKNTGAFDSKNDGDDLARAKPGDDAAAMAFRQMLAAAASGGDSNNGRAAGKGDDELGDKDHTDSKTFKFTASLQGSMVQADSRYNEDGEKKSDDAIKSSKLLKDSRSALEKEVGRKNRSSQNNLSYEQQIERFPQLKNAPMAVKRGTSTAAEGDEGETKTSAPMMVHFKPLGSQILHVRCLACGIWGHARGDRECKKSGWNPFALPSSTSAVKDRQQPGASTSIVSSSILPSKRGDSMEQNGSLRSSKHKESSSSSEHRHRRRRHRERLDSDGDKSDRRRHSRHRRRHNESDEDNYSDDDSSSRKRDRRRRKHHRHRGKEHYSARDDSNNHGPSSEDISKLKRRNGHRYDSSEDERRPRRDSRKQSRDRHRNHKASKKRSRSQRYESSSPDNKKKKKKRHSSP